MKKSGILFVLLSAMCFATGGILIKLNGWNAVALNGARSIFAFGVVSIYMMLTHHKFRVNWAIIFGAFANSGMSVTFTLATKLTTAANAIVLQFTMPVFVILLLWALWKQKPNKLAVGTVAVSLLGMVCFFIDSLSSGNMAGNIIAIVSGFLYAFVFLVKKIPGSDFQSSMLISFVINLLMGLPFLLQETDFGPANLITVFLLGTLQFGCAYVFLDMGLNYVQPVAASLISMIEPIMNPILVALFYHETMGPMALVGAAIVLGSATVYNVLSIKAQESA